MFAEAWCLGRRCVWSWQAWHFAHLRFHLRGRRAAFSTCIDVCGSVAPGTPLHFAVASVALAARQVPYAWQACYFQYLHRCLRKRGACRCVLSWQAWHLQHLRFHLRGRRGSFYLSVGVSLWALQVPFASAYLRRCVAPGTPLRFVVAGVALAACPRRHASAALSGSGACKRATCQTKRSRFHLRLCYFQYLRRCLRKRGAWDAAAFCRGRRGTCSTSGSICVAGVLLSVPA